MDHPFIWYKNIGRSFYHFVTMHAFGRQTDRQMLIVIPRPHSYSAVKMIQIILKTALSYENPHTGFYCQQAPVHRPNVSFIYKQSIHGTTVTNSVVHF